MILKYNFYLIFLWIALIQWTVTRGGSDQERIHIKVHVPQIYQKHFHHKTVAKHHYHHPKKHRHNHINHEALTSNLEPQIEYSHKFNIPAVIPKYSKNSAPVTWYSDSPTGYSIENPKFVRTKPSMSTGSEPEEYNALKNRFNNNFNYGLDFDGYTKNSQQSAQQHETSLKDFRINLENDYKRPHIKHYSNYHANNQQDQQDEYTEEDTDSYVENTASMTIPSPALPYTAHSLMLHGNDDYNEPHSLPSEDSYSNLYSNSNWIKHGKRNNDGNFKMNNNRPNYDDVPVRIYGQNSWMPHIQSNLYNDWNSDNVEKKPSMNPSKRIPFHNGHKDRHPQIDYSNDNVDYEEDNEHDYRTSVTNDYQVRNKRPRRKSKPKRNRYPNKDFGYDF